MTLTYTLLITGGIFGLLIGSFLNVCIFRIPYGKYEPVRPGLPMPEEVTHAISVSSPKRSFCPKCKAELKWYHNVPLFSWIFLRGKCAFCSAPISWRYPMVEVLTSISAILAIMRFGPTPTAFLIFVFACALIVITYIDLDYMIIPDLISLPGTVIGILIGLVQSFLTYNGEPIFLFPVVPNVMQSIYGVLFGAGVLYFFAKIYIFLRKKDGLGLGDVKLLALVGALLGPASSYFTIMVGSLVAIIIMVPTMLITKKSIQNYLPFGPFLAVAAFAYAMGLGDSYFEIFRGFPAPAWWISERW